VARIYDLSLPLDAKTLLFPGDPAPHVYRVSTIEGGAALTTSAFETTCHVGTHVDSPAHYLSGARWLSDYKVEEFCGPAVVVDLAAERVQPRRALALEVAEAVALRDPVGTRVESAARVEVVDVTGLALAECSRQLGHERGGVVCPCLGDVLTDQPFTDERREIPTVVGDVLPDRRPLRCLVGAALVLGLLGRCAVVPLRGDRLLVVLG